MQNEVWLGVPISQMGDWHKADEGGKVQERCADVCRLGQTNVGASLDLKQGYIVMLDNSQYFRSQAMLQARKVDQYHR